MLNRFTLIGVLFFSFLFMGCLNNAPTTTNSTVSDNMVKFENSDITLNYAPVWNVTVDEYDSSYEVTFTSPNSESGVVVVVQTLTSAPNLNALKEKQLAIANDYAILQSKQDVTLAGVPAFETVFNLKAQAVTATQVSYVLVKGNKVVKLTYIYANENEKPEFESIVQSLVLK